MGFKQMTKLCGTLLLAIGIVAGVSLNAHAAPPYGSPNYLDHWIDNNDLKKKRWLRDCVPATDYRLRGRVAEQGYFNIYLGGDIGRNGNKEVRATRGDDVYLLEVDKCTGKVEAEHYLRPAINGR